ncbi:hypothetical protein G8T76_10765 [Clostridium botulinum C/D]|uniref:hypothetical protein n=1 Tax=Clostridium botulinum TaxID=1491 RepID=UPI0003165671|nr:hypothetical protein [Clostridium botulinum]KEI02879.1 hypothetical protein Y848_06300 [Clostridium botulinum C/D str. Sp77]KOA76885.1 hypothetical protein ADU78_05360 [Clostridium botulinum]KOA80930.1 hypothetical protein ADU77_00090 [Clostridium botulinum]KOA88956.1 hypothetical protein ADU75_00820 [Clostridium botulinum]KOC31859.1 hypothetical protein ADU83_12085 [Clostridium botulinum]
MEFLKQFLQIKKIIALLTTIVFSILALRGHISSTEFLSVFTLIIGFYFGQSSTRQAIKEQDK